MVKDKKRGKRKKFTHISKDNQKLIDDYVRFWTIKRTLSPSGQHNVRSALEKLADYLGKKSFKDATKQDLIDYFGNEKIFNQINRSRDSNAVLVIPFYRWIEGIEGKTRPSILRWYEHQSSRHKRRHKDPYNKEKHLITSEDYEKIMNASNDAYGQNKALWELMYLSGARPSEIAQLKIKNVSEENGNYTITIDTGTSKTDPRPIALPETPYNLARWLGNHPTKNDLESPLWVSLKTSEKIDASNEEFITRRFNTLKQKSSVKKTLTAKDFRKTRGTLLFGDKTYNDGDIGKWMGWTPQTVALRRQEYDLSDFEDLKKKVFSRPSIPISYEAIEQEKKTIEEKHGKEIEDLRKDMEKLTILVLQSTVLLAPHIKKQVKDKKTAEAYKNYKNNFREFFNDHYFEKDGKKVLLRKAKLDKNGKVIYPDTKE